MLFSFVKDVLHNLYHTYMQGRRNGGALRGHCPLCRLKVGSTGTQVPLHTNIINNFLIYQDQFETNSLQLFAHT